MNILKNQPRKMANNQDSWSKIKSRYGDGVVRYLKVQDVQPEKIVGSVYKVLHVDILNQCAKISTTLREKCLNGPPMKKRRMNNSSDSQSGYNCYDLPEHLHKVVDSNFEKTLPKKNMPSKVKATNLPVEVNLLICLDLLYKQKNKMPELSFQSLKQPRPSWDYEEMFHRMMKTYIGHQKEIKYNACLKDMTLVLKKFHKRHNKFNYPTCLKTIMRMKNSSGKNAPTVSIHQLEKYFYNISMCVIPKEMFGNNANLKKLRRALRKYFLSSWKETVPLKSYVMSMDISCITWLKSILDVETQWLIIAKLARWLFEVYFLGILKTIFTVKKDLYSEKKIFLSSLRWRRRMNHYIKTQERKKTWVQVNPVDDSIQKDTVVSAANCNLYPKENGVRCVHSYRIDQSIRDDKATPTFAMLKVLLQQLYNEKYESTTIQKLYPLWLSLAEEKQQNPNHPYFLVSTDIVDAYGSVIQTKLYNILHEMIMEIPGDKITLEWLAILKPNLFYKKNSVEYIQWFSCCSSLPPIPPHSLISFATSDQHPKEFISKEKICSLLQKCITQQIVSYKDTKYILKEGLPQGFPLSPILSDIYYAHMTKQEFAVFMKSGVLARYVDDFLYITDQKDAAKEFMNRVRKGVPEYHCRFKTSKTQTNLISARWGSTEYVTYLGYLIDCATLEVSPLHTDSKFHHLKSMQCIKYKNEQQTLAMRLRNFSALKLSPIVLDPKINSIGTILSTVRSAAYTMASRCAVLIPRVYPKCQSYVCEIWEEVRRAVEIVTSKFVTYFRKKRNKPSRTVTRYIKTLIWKKFYEVFAKNASLHQCFGKDIRRMVQNQSVI